MLDIFVVKSTHAAPTKFAPRAGTCQALEIFERKEKEKERLAKEKAERDEKLYSIFGQSMRATLFSAPVLSLCVSQKDACAIVARLSSASSVRPSRR